MVQKFKYGDVIVARVATQSYFGEVFNKGDVLVVTRADLDADGDICARRFNGSYGYCVDPADFDLKVDDVPNEVIEEPDLYVYPDTPVGTELIVTQDTKSYYGVPIPKGTVVKLSKSAYYGDGGYRAVDIPKHLSNVWHDVIVDCDHLMIKG